jgi:hypothetical protein
MGEAMLFAATIPTSKKGKWNATCTGSFGCIDPFRNWIYGSLSMGSCRGVAGSLARRNGDRTWRVCGETPLLPVVIRSQWEPRVPETTGALRGVSSRLRDGDNQPTRSAQNSSHPLGRCPSRYLRYSHHREEERRPKAPDLILDLDCVAGASGMPSSARSSVDRDESIWTTLASSPRPSRI